MEVGNRETQEQGTGNKLRCEIVHKMWAVCYDHKGVAKLKSAIIRHLYKPKFGQDAMSHAYDVCKAYDSLSY